MTSPQSRLWQHSQVDGVHAHMTTFTFQVPQPHPIQIATPSHLLSASGLRVPYWTSARVSASRRNPLRVPAEAPLSTAIPSSLIILKTHSEPAHASACHQNAPSPLTIPMLALPHPAIAYAMRATRGTAPPPNLLYLKLGPQSLPAFATRS